MKHSVGNIQSIKFLDTWPNGRKFKHGALEVKFLFQPKHREAAEGDIEAFMEYKGYERGKDYTIPGYNYSIIYREAREMTWVREPFIVTFTSDEIFVMAKMTWNVDEEY